MDPDLDGKHYLYKVTGNDGTYEVIHASEVLKDATEILFEGHKKDGRIRDFEFLEEIMGFEKAMNRLTENGMDLRE